MSDIDKIADGLKVLSEYKDSPGHKAMVEIAYQNMSSCMSAFMYDDDVDLLQLRADFRAWMDIVTAVDKRMGNYEMQIKMVLEQTERQLQANQGGSF